MKRRVVVSPILLGLTALLAGCFPKSDGSSGCPVCPHRTAEMASYPAVETVDRGVKSGIKDQRLLVIRDLGAWQALWAEHKAGQYPMPPMPYVDFTKEMVIGAFLGEKPTSSYNVEIVGLRQSEEGLVVRVRVTTPPPGALLLQVLTQPYHLVKVPRYDGPVSFEISVVEGKTRT